MFQNLPNPGNMKKEGVVKFAQDLLSIFEFQRGRWESFGTPYLHLWRFIKVWHHLYMKAKAHGMGFFQHIRC